MNDLAALSGTHAMTVLVLMRLVLTVVMVSSMVIRSALVRGSRTRSRVSTVLRTTVIPVTILATVEAAVGAAAGEWDDMFWGMVMLSMMPLYFRWANDEDDWWAGRWTKIRKSVTAAFSRAAGSAVPQH